jgi:hypothetical protein
VVNASSKPDSRDVDFDINDIMKNR